MFKQLAVVTLTNDPLDPDDIIASALWYEVLQAATEVVPHSLAVVSQVRFGLFQELLRDVDQVDCVEQRQQQTLGDPPDAGSTVQSTASACLPLALLQW